MYKDTHRWGRLLKKQLSIPTYRLQTKENKLPFSVYVSRNKGKFTVSIFHLQQKTEVAVFR
jgi:hypothetical protein